MLPHLALLSGLGLLLDKLLGDLSELLGHPRLLLVELGPGLGDLLELLSQLRSLLGDLGLLLKGLVQLLGHLRPLLSGLGLLLLKLLDLLLLGLALLLQLLDLLGQLLLGLGLLLLQLLDRRRHEVAPEALRRLWVAQARLATKDGLGCGHERRHGPSKNLPIALIN